MKIGLLLCFCLWLPSLVHAQTTVTGQITDGTNGQGLSGVTILQLSTVNGVMTNTDGSFSLTVPGRFDSVRVSISAIGYVKQQRLIAAGGNTVFKLNPDQRQIISDDVLVYARYNLGVTSGVRYAPYGVLAQVFGQQFIGIPLCISGSYQTNFKSNYATTAAVSLSTLPKVDAVSFSEKLEYQRLRAAANAQFTSYSATLGLTFFPKATRLPELLIGAGYARYQPLQPTEASTSAGYGYGAGFRYGLPYPLNVHVQAQATRWPAYWQFQGSISRSIGHSLLLGVAAHQLRCYKEVSLQLSRSFH
ncbi:carboxypeptidase-like regulatory domain-containing protein [Hymenobacter sp. BT635]|uniref:Carboxypeptidase-like regulatory domain-containing protein n=1 Tax=Hymenobacter nitidus TaxID=2880929 RepID=A0ABS8ACI5_9BACT|nr:carboxypeptidase-like regulatory domain-containing protein [Hymenobacter nitidus]MCB2377586.1 carboxypeptidase-like regulatory domain-containing protein [Hymenobacter nitidus]